MQLSGIEPTPGEFTLAGAGSKYSVLHVQIHYKTAHHLGTYSATSKSDRWPRHGQGDSIAESDCRRQQPKVTTCPHEHHAVSVVKTYKIKFDSKAIFLRISQLVNWFSESKFTIMSHVLSSEQSTMPMPWLKQSCFLLWCSFLQLIFGSMLCPIPEGCRFTLCFSKCRCCHWWLCMLDNSLALCQCQQLRQIEHLVHRLLSHFGQKQWPLKVSTTEFYLLAEFTTWMELSCSSSHHHILVNHDHREMVSQLFISMQAGLPSRWHHWALCHACSADNGKQM